MADYDGITQFHKAGLRRLQDAQQLLEPPTLEPHRSDATGRHLRAAVYLAGYAVECALKEYFISHTLPFAYTLTEAIEIRRDAGQSIPNLFSAEGHRLHILLSLTGLENEKNTDEDIRFDWDKYLCHWQSTWRYDPDPPKIGFARQFVPAAGRFHAWVQRRV